MIKKVFDENSMNYVKDVPEYNLAYLRQQELYFNEYIKCPRKDEWVLLKEVLNALDLPVEEEDLLYGWKKNGVEDHIDFGIKENEDGTYSLDFNAYYYLDGDNKTIKKMNDEIIELNRMIMENESEIKELKETIVRIMVRYVDVM